MSSYTLKGLVDAYDTEIISERLLKIRLHEYITNIYDQAISNGQYPYLSSAISKNAVNIDSIVDRIFIAINSTPNDLYSVINNPNEVTEIKNMNTDGYECFRCEESKVALGKINIKGFKQKMSISIGLETGTVYILSTGYVADRSGDSLKAETYALADCSLIDILDWRKNRYSSVGKNYLDNSVLCNRFDPSHMQISGSKGFSREDNKHKNRFAEAGITDPNELALYKKYFTDEAYCPHFHFFRKSVCANLHKNTASFAINISNLSRYLDDLEAAYNSKKVNDPILKYDLGMPYLDIVKGKLHCNMEDFIKTSKSVFKNYYGKNRSAGMESLYNLVDCIKRNDSFGCVNSAVKIIEFVSYTPVLGFEQECVYGENDREYNNDKNIKLSVILADSFAQGIGPSVDAKNLLKNKKHESGFGDDDVE